MSVPINEWLARNAYLPYGWRRFFNQRGRGVEIKCAFCSARPPKNIKGYARWKWIAVHEVTRHPRIAD